VLLLFQLEQLAAADAAPAKSEPPRAFTHACTGLTACQ
jgi:hypothetical protein